MQSAVAPNDKARMLRARLEILSTTFPAVAWVNPSWAVISVLPFTGLVPMFGTVSPWRLALVLGLHLCNSIFALCLGAEYRRDRSDDITWLRRIIAFQVFVGIIWGVTAWLLWVAGNPVNHLLVVLFVVALMSVYAFSRGTHSGALLASTTPLMVFAIARFLYQPDQISTTLTLILFATYIYAIGYARVSRRRYLVMLKTQFANDDLAAELRLARDEALRKRSEAEAANASKTAFLANMSHELRTPLNAILGFSDLIANERLGATRYREYANDIKASGAHLLSLINDILDITKIESGKMELDARRLSPRAAIEQALLVVVPRAREKNQHIETDIANDGAGLFADERAFKQILINLTANAVKFTPEGSHIRVSGQGTSDGGYEILVEDNGPGIPGDLLDTVFLPFNQIDNRYSRQTGGTGLGLSLVRGLANLHGGRAWIESEEGRGVRARVYFPSEPHSPVVRPVEERLRA